MSNNDKQPPKDNPGPDDGSIDRPRLTPQAGTADEAAGEDHTDPAGEAKQGPGDKAEG